MNWTETESEIRAAIRAKPRGFQTELARKLEISQPSVAAFVGGKRSFPAGHLDAVLEALGLELELRKKQ